MLVELLMAGTLMVPKAPTGLTVEPVCTSQACKVTESVQRVKRMLEVTQFAGTAITHDGGDSLVLQVEQWRRFLRTDHAWPIWPESACDDVVQCAQRGSGMCKGAGHGTETCRVEVIQHGDGSRTCYGECCGDLAGAVFFVTCGPPL